jgi:hypothetical protein
MFSSWVSGNSIVLPDYSGYFLRGIGTNTNTTVVGPTTCGSTQTFLTARPVIAFSTSSNGAHTHTETLDNVAAHTHTWSDNGAPTGPRAITLVGNTGTLDGGTSSISSSTNAAHSHTMTVGSSGSHAHSSLSGGDSESRPYNISVIWAIKAF